MIQPKKYIRKPLRVRAVQVTAENFLEMAFWCKGSIKNIDGSTVENNSIDPEKQFIQVPVSHPRSDSQAQAKIGDWVLKNEKGYKVYTDKAFTNSFDLDEPKAREEEQEPVTPEPHEPEPAEPVTPDAPHEPTPTEPAVEPSQPPTEAQAA